MNNCAILIQECIEKTHSTISPNLKLGSLTLGVPLMCIHFSPFHSTTVMDRRSNTVIYTLAYTISFIFVEHRVTTR